MELKQYPSTSFYSSTDQPPPIQPHLTPPSSPIQQPPFPSNQGEFGGEDDATRVDQFPNGSLQLLKGDSVVCLERCLQR